MKKWLLEALIIVVSQNGRLDAVTLKKMGEGDTGDIAILLIVGFTEN